MTSAGQGLRLVIDPCEALPDGRRFVLTGDDALIGRDVQCDVVVEVETVSARHGIFRATGRGYTYTDLSSRNGSALLRADDASPVAIRAGQQVDVAPGQVLLLGDVEDRLSIRLEPGPGFATSESSARTVLARAPLVDLVHEPPDGVLRLAAGVVDTDGIDGLYSAAESYFSGYYDGPMHIYLRTGVDSRTSEVMLPKPVEQLSGAHREVVRAEVDSYAILIAPFVARDVDFGFVAMWSEEKNAFGPSLVDATRVGAPLVALAAHAIARRPSGHEADDRARESGAGDGAVQPFGQSKAFRRAADLGRSIAPSTVSVLLTGETGTGKEVFARAIHRWSPRCNQPFVAINCAAIPATLLESELFGHVKGAFTGATSDRAGMFEDADQGTLFLDEIAEMPLELQARLLRVLEDRTVRRVGANEGRTVDVRVISATNKNLEEHVSSDKFRSDLMYRLNPVTIAIPPLRERGGDRVLLAHALLNVAAHASQKTIPGFSPEALLCIAQYDFPGNVRELRNEIERAVALTPDGEAVRPHVFSDKLCPSFVRETEDETNPETPSLKEAVAATERFVALRALERHNHHVASAAAELGMTRAGLHKLLARHGLRNDAD